MYAISIVNERAMTAPGSVRNIFKIALQRVYNFKVDVIAEDANLAAYQFYKRQDYQDLHNSSVVVLLREMQREVNMGRFTVGAIHFR